MTRMIPCYCYLLTIVFVSVTNVLSLNMSGVVKNNRGTTLQGAVVSLKSYALTDTTDIQGKFSFASVMSRTVNRTGRGPAVHFTLSRSALLFDNPGRQNVDITLFDLRGKVIGRVYSGLLPAGIHRFALPPFTANMTVLADARIGSVRETFRMVGTAMHQNGTCAGAADDVFLKSDGVTDVMTVTHSAYDPEIRVVSVDANNLEVRLYKKLYVDRTMTLFFQDTVRCADRDIMLSFDTLIDSRCGCDVFCGWEGNADLHFTATIAGVSYPLVLGTSGSASKDTTVGGYNLSMLDIKPDCPQESLLGYRVTVVFTPVAPPERVLFVEHFINKDGTVVYGDCPMLCIDFPTYSFNEKTAVLQYQSIFDTAAVSTNVIYGCGTSLLGEAGFGASSWLRKIPSFPFTDQVITISDLDEDGTITVSYKQQTRIMPPGEVWCDTTTVKETSSESCVAEITTIDRISNFGFLAPRQIQSQSYSQ